MSQAKWKMQNGRWVKVSAFEPQVNGFEPKMNGTSLSNGETLSKVNGFAPIVQTKTVEPKQKIAQSEPKIPEPESKIAEPEPKTVESEPVPETDMNNNPPKLNIKFEDLLRGSTPENIENRCIQLSKAYLGGSWSNIKSNADVTVTRIPGGLTNQLYRIHLNDSVERVPNDIYLDEPSDVAIKLYQEKHMKNYSAADGERLNDNIILTIVSEVEIGPKVYGIFKDGVILAYHDHEQFRSKHQQDPVLLKELATLLARIHHLNVPIAKSENLMFKDLEENIDYGYDKLNVQEIIDELKLENLSKKNLRVTYAEMLEHMKQMDSPIVFCHHDFRGGNILVTKPDNKIKIVDLEYSGYGPRGYDFGTFMTEWGKKDIFEQVFYILPPSEAIEQFAKYYIEAADNLVPGYSQDPINSVERIVKETKLYYMVQIMFFMSFMIKQEVSIIPTLPFDPKTKMTYIENFYDRYNKIVNALIEDGTISKLD